MGIESMCFSMRTLYKYGLFHLFFECRLVHMLIV